MTKKFKTGYTEKTGILAATQHIVDFSVRSDMSISLLEPLTAAAREWVEEHLPEDHQTFGNSVVVENRYMPDIVTGIRRDGLAVR